MLNIKSLTTGVAAAAFVSAIGLAYAQTPTYPPATTSDTPAATSAPAPMQPATTAAPSDTPLPSSTPSTTVNDAPSNSAAEPAPQADRN